MNLIQTTRQFMIDEKIDYLLVNSTNEFLVEYNKLEENSRFHLTNFSGSTGDALLGLNDLFLFVDGRYHAQADLEVDKNIVKVIKMKVGETFIKTICTKIKKNSKLGIVSTKVSQGRLEILQANLKAKNVQIKLLDKDPICNGFDNVGKQEKINGDDKIKAVTQTLNSNEAIFTSNLEEVSYITNKRDFSSNYSSVVKGKLLITKTRLLQAEAFAMTDFIKKNNINTVYLDKTTTSVADFKRFEHLKIKNTKLIKEMKSTKTDDEITHLKTCFARADKTLDEVRNFIEANENLSEFDITKKLEETFYKYGAKSLSFKSIVAKDQNAAFAHYSKNSKNEILKDGSLVLIDCGAYYEQGLATDMTRVFVKGTPTNLQKQVYTIVLKGFLNAFNTKISARTSGFAIDKKARKILDELAPSGFSFGHSLGHGIGISVHESPPTLSPSILSKTPLKPNMCFTIEPGLYNLKHFGIRLENSCYLADNKIQSFSKMCFEKKLIDFSALSAREKKYLKEFELK